MRTAIVTFVASFLVMIAFTTSASAAFVVTIGNGTVTAGGSMAVPVYGHSDNPSGESLDAFGLELRIARLSGIGTLAFVDPQSGAELASSQYVFDGNSANQLFGLGVLISSPTDYIGGDGTLDGLGVTVGTTNRLLATLNLDATHAAVGDTYSISLIGTGSGNGTTFFVDQGVTQFYNWSTNTGTVTITGSINPVPVPPSIILALSGLICFAATGPFIRRTK